MDDNFVVVRAHAWNIDRWIVRRSILKNLRRIYPELHGRLLDIGCGGMPYRKDILESTRVTEYVGLDLESALDYNTNVRPDVRWDGIRIPLADSTFECAIATEVVEHVTDIEIFLSEVHRVLKPGGIVFMTTPFLWPYHEVPHDMQRWTKFGLERHILSAGFSGVTTYLEGNWHSSLAQFIGLWVARAPMPRLIRLFLRMPGFVAQWLLFRFDGPSSPSERAMPRMTVCIARK